MAAETLPHFAWTPDDKRKLVQMRTPHAEGRGLLENCERRGRREEGAVSGEGEREGAELQLTEYSTYLHAYIRHPRRLHKVPTSE